ncbi:hypothetical protein AB0H00_13720 [Nocardia sp. NPDC023852]|uniref:hypothetical protein n=1 Tax=Nocardia sp. NPDC023852 TaxID=3154697 RepID=UPI0033C0D5D2
MAPITMNTALVGNAAGLYKTAYDGAETKVKTLATALDADWDAQAATVPRARGPAVTTRPPSKQWRPGTDIVNAFGKLHDLLASTAVNHSNVEKQNKQPPEPPDPDPTVLPATTAPTFKGAFGGATDPPFGWEMISSWL